ncbi:hypothetical protein BsIDN1_62810 [Bacillus safensis]|uniref:Uncharacterized protein n=1 Tax=Bacillus safensis TaxID=561879 RepID=A0A5S9MHS9_BACIA|nr:hypothetical protein BsIDN1_62810 [Bacillus safensis]
MTRISGANRYELSVNIIKKLNINADKVYLAKASSYIYAMPLSQLAAKSNSTVVYVKPDSVTASLKALLKEKKVHMLIILLAAQVQLKIA